MILRFLFAMLSASLLGLSPAGRAAADLGPYAVPGPFGVGVRTFVLVDQSRPTMAYGPYDGSPVRELEVEIWYPADTGEGLAENRDAAPAATAKPFPVVLRAHGLGGRRRDAVYLTSFLASHGYVVVAPDFPLSKLNTPAILPTYFDVARQPGDLSFVLERMLVADGPIAFLAGSLDGTKIGTLGHSLGGLTVLLHGYGEGFRDFRIRAVAALAPWACSLQDEFFIPFGEPPPSLWMGGTADLITPYDANQLSPFDRAVGPRVLVTLEDAVHINFSRALFDVESGENPDDAYCDATFGLLGLRPLETPKLPPSVGDKPGINRAGCGSICSRFDGEWMAEQRQHELTRAAVVAFFDAELRGSLAAHDVLVAGIDDENDATSVSVEDICGFGACAVGERCMRCGQPASIDRARPSTADALFVLRAAVGTGGACPPCVCDVNADLAVQASDALAVLARAVGLGAELACLRPSS